MNAGSERHDQPAATRRLFFALWPDDVLRRELERRLDGRLPERGGRRVPSAKLHITLVFLGPVPEHRLACIEHAAAKLSARPFELVLDRIGWWRNPQVLWLGGSETPPELIDLVERLQAGIGACGIALEARPFRAHMTLMRKVRRRPASCSIDPLVWKPREFLLVESSAERGMVRYQTRASWPLG